MAETTPFHISITPLNFASLSSPSSLANSCTSLVDVWRIIKDLTRSELATVPGQRRRTLFLVWLKNRRVLAPAFFASAATPKIQAAFFVQEDEKTYDSDRIPRIIGVEDRPPKALYIKDEIWESSPHTKLQEGMSSEINFAQFPREPSTAKSALLHKGAIEYTFRVSKRSASSHKSTNDDAPRAPKHQERVLSRRRDPSTHGGTRFDRPWRGPENIKILLLVRGAGSHDFEGLLWGQRV